MIALAILAAVFIGYSLVAARLDKSSITAPMVFVLVGGAPSGSRLPTGSDRWATRKR